MELNSSCFSICNLTSQWLANLYLDGTDHWLKETRRAPGYARYMDDLAVWSDSKDFLWELATDLDERLQAGLGLTLKTGANYAKVPLCRPRFGSRGIWERDGGICQYTGRKLAPGEGNIDHVVPRSRGGDSRWENCVLSHREVNSRKGDRLPHEVGLRLVKHPVVPRAVPATLLIRNQHDIRDWRHFLKR